MLNMRTLNSAWTTYSKLSTIRYDKNWQSRYFGLKYRSDSKHYFTYSHAFHLAPYAKLYTPSTPNNSNETHTFMCLGRTGRFGQR